MLLKPFVQVFANANCLLHILGDEGVYQARLRVVASEKSVVGECDRYAAHAIELRLRTDDDPTYRHERTGCRANQGG
jgi:hypothetical protein